MHLDYIRKHVNAEPHLTPGMLYEHQSSQVTAAP